jgi:hypothetical protein
VSRWWRYICRTPSCNEQLPWFCLERIIATIKEEKVHVYVTAYLLLFYTLHLRKLCCETIAAYKLQGHGWCTIQNFIWAKFHCSFCGYVINAVILCKIRIVENSGYILYIASPVGVQYTSILVHELTALYTQ